MKQCKPWGELGFSMVLFQPAAEPVPKDKYRSDEEQQQVTVLIVRISPRRTRISFRSFGKTGKELTHDVRGLTPKGFRRLRELQAPRRVWFEENWFPVVVAGIAHVDRYCFNRRRFDRQSELNGMTLNNFVAWVGATGVSASEARRLSL